MSFEDIFHTDFSVANNAHARVNLIGEHTDYTGVCFAISSKFQNNY